VERLARDGDGASVEVQDRVVPRDGARLTGVLQAQSGAHAGDKLLDPEGFGHVIDGASAERSEPDVELGAGGEDDDGRGNAAAPELEDVEAVELGEHPIEDDHVEWASESELGAPTAVVRELDRKPGGLESTNEPRGDRRVVFNHEDVGRRRPFALTHG
jgi:hypothetical protein